MTIAILFAGLMVARPGYGQTITNGGFETKDFTGWTLTQHKATPPTNKGGPDIDTGGQVLRARDFWIDAHRVVERHGLVNPGLAAPEGKYFALISSTPGSLVDQPFAALCPISLVVPGPAPADRDSDTHGEFDVTTLEQTFTVSSLPAQFNFMWSFLNSEGATELHDTFIATLEPIAPAGPTITLMSVTAGNEFVFPSCLTLPVPCAGPNVTDSTYLDINSFDGSTYEVITTPAGGGADCFYADAGRTPFVPFTYTIPSTGTWKVTFYFGDDGGDERGDSGVLIDAVSVAAPPVASGQCPVQPRGDCTGSTTVRKDRLVMGRSLSHPNRNSMRWTWAKGPDNPLWGNPVTTDTYQVCQYNPWGLVQAFDPIPFGGICGTRACWTLNQANTFGYRNTAGTHSGIKGMTLKGSTVYGKSSAVVRAKGTLLPPPPLPLVVPTTIQLVNDAAGTCFTSTFTYPGKNKAPTATRGGGFSATGD